MTSNLPAPYREMADVGEMANEAARLTVFANYYSTKSENMRKAMRNTLRVWTEYLATKRVKAEVKDLYDTPSTWHGVTHGLIQGFKLWCVQQSYAVSGINTMLSHLKIYCGLAMDAGVIAEYELFRIRRVKSYARREMPNIDDDRKERKIEIRRSVEKDTHTAINHAQAHTLKHMHPGTPRGRRNAVLMALLLDHGLRADEASKLTVRGVKLADREFEFYRSKSGSWQRLAMSSDLQAALLPYLKQDAATSGPLLLSNRKHKPDELNTNGMSRQRIFDEVRSLGEDAGVSGPLSPHDCRVRWAISSYRRHKDLARLQREGGWNSPHMPMHYMQEALEAEERERNKDEDQSR